MKSLKLALVAAAAAAVMAPASAEGLSYSAGIFTANSSDVRADDFRPSVELGVNYGLASGFYAGAGYVTGKYENQTKAQGELSFNAGFGQELSNGVSYDINVARYIYTSSTAGNYNEMTLTVGYGPVSAAYYKSFKSDGGFYGDYGLDLTYTHGFTDKIEGYFTVTKSEGVSSLGYELGASYDLGDNLSASALYEKGAKPKFILGLTKGF
jgi:hypothetical protein